MNFKRILAAAMCLCITAPMAIETPVRFASAVTVDNSVKTEYEDIYMYKNYGDHVEICAVSTMAEGNIIVPDTIAGVPVTEVGEHGFAGTSKVTSVTLPDTVTVIGKQAFSGCTALKKVNIPSRVTAIGDEAFLNCLSLENIKLPYTLTSIGVRSFYNCQKLTEIYVPDGVSYMGEGAFSSCTGLKSFRIPASVTALEDSVLSNCKSITTLTLPINIEKIGMMSLPSSLTSLTILNPDFETDNLLMNLNKNCTLNLPGNSSVIEFAQENGITFNIYMYCIPIPGDVNFDSEFTIADLVMMSEYLLGKRELPSYELGDMNNDGVVDVYDFVLMRQEYNSTLPSSAINLCENIEAVSATGKKADAAFTLAQTEFSLNLFKNEQQKEESVNTLISPYSVMQALAMTANGADGDTKTGMETALGGISIDELNKYLFTQQIEQPSAHNNRFMTANSIWAKDDGSITVYPEFLQTVKGYFNSDFFTAPFDKTTITDINKWVDLNTDGMIKNYMKELAPDAVMYLVNAALFEAEWAEQYDSEYNVSNGEFTAFDGAVQDCELMHSQEYSYIGDDNSVGFMKYYKDYRYAFAAILPDEDISLDEYISGLTAESLNKMFSNISRAKINASLPKFSYDYETLLNDSLKSMGMESAFDQDADFSKMGETDTGNLFINNVRHKTHIDVNESGTKAAAVTSVEMSAGASPEPDEPINICLDRPFLYCIVDTQTNIPVFIGTLETID